MSQLKAGFARIDITPPLGTNLVGYFNERIADGILDPLLATAVAVSDGANTAVILSADLIGIAQEVCDRIRDGIAERTGICRTAVFVACTHTHLGPAMSKKYEVYKEEVVGPIVQKLIGVAQMAIDDLKPATMYTNAAQAPVEISFIRRYKMKDGSTRTNPGYLNPEIDHPIGESDHRVALTYFRRENAPEIALINFQVHPDVIGGTKMSADFPYFVRKTYEAAVENSLCMYINGPQGDTNHCDVSAPEGMLRRGYEMSQHMGRVIAGTAMCLRAKAFPTEGVPVRAFQKNIMVPHNKGTAEEVENAKRIDQLYREERFDEICPAHDMRLTTIIAEARRMINLADMPDDKELYISGVAMGDFALVGFPGEPFTVIGTEVKNASPFAMTFAACCANGYEGYYPAESAYAEGGYEAKTAKYKAGVAETLIATGKEVLETLHTQKSE